LTENGLSFSNWFYFEGRFPAGCEYDIYNQSQLSPNWSVRKKYGLKSIFAANWLGTGGDVRHVIGCLNTVQPADQKYVHQELFGTFFGETYGLKTEGVQPIIDYITNHVQKPTESFWALRDIQEGSVIETGNVPFVKPPNNSYDQQVLQLLHNGSINETSKCYDFFLEGYISTNTLDANLQEVNGIEKRPSSWGQSTFPKAHLTVEKKGDYSKIVGVVEAEDNVTSEFISSIVFAVNSGRAIGITRTTKRDIGNYVQHISGHPFYILQWNLPNVRTDSDTSVTSFNIF